MSAASKVLGGAGVASALGGAVLLLLSPAKPNVQIDASRLWANGGAGLREPLRTLSTLDNGDCQTWAQRCSDNICKAACE